MFVDKCQIEVISGKGGNGNISFNHEKYVMKLGPSGGNGGNGGSIFFQTDNNVEDLSLLNNLHLVVAKNGENGEKQNCHGSNAPDIFLKIPVGTTIYDAETHELINDLTQENQIIMIVKGGKGGKGNLAFKNNKNKMPKFAENGFPGERKKIILELKIIADIGLIGMPNAGKSTFLSIVTNSKPKIANYFFTTIRPNLGIVNFNKQRFVLADLPGLIKDANKGKGLGLNFLRHIERCKIIIHMIDFKEKKFIKNYKIISNEIKKYNPYLLKKPTIIVASKVDNNGIKKEKIRLNRFKKKIKKNIFGISSLTHYGVNKLIKKCCVMLQKKTINITNANVNKVKKNYIANDLNIIKDTKNNNWVITSKKILTINTSNDEGIKYLLNFLKKIEIEKIFEKKGIKNGDTIKINNLVFTYTKK